MKVRGRGRIIRHGTVNPVQLGSSYVAPPITENIPADLPWEFQGASLVEMYRMEELTPAKIEQLVLIIRAVLNDEMNRTSSYLGMDIFRDGKDLNYAVTDHQVGDLSRQHFIRFEANEDAERFEETLFGLLRMALVKFEVHQGNQINGIGHGPIREGVIVEDGG